MSISGISFNPFVDDLCRLCTVAVVVYWGCRTVKWLIDRSSQDSSVQKTEVLVQPLLDENSLAPRTVSSSDLLPAPHLTRSASTLQECSSEARTGPMPAAIRNDMERVTISQCGNVQLHDYRGGCKITRRGELDEYLLSIDGNALAHPSMSKQFHSFIFFNSTIIEVIEINGDIKIEERNSKNPDRTNLYSLEKSVLHEDAYHIYPKLSKELYQLITTSEFLEGEEPKIVCYNYFGIIVFPKKPEAGIGQYLYYRSLYGEGELQRVWASSAQDEPTTELDEPTTELHVHFGGRKLVVEYLPDDTCTINRYYPAQVVTLS